MKIDKKFILNYKEVIIGAFIILLSFIFGVKQIIGSFSKISKTKIEHKKESVKLKDVKKKVKEAQQAKEKLMAKQNKIKPVFDPKNGSEDSIASFGGMFEDIIDYVKINNLKLRSVEYVISPHEDPICSQMPTLYNVCKIQLFVICNYQQLEGFMRDLTLYPYFLNIGEIKIHPYEKDNSVLLVELMIIMYSKKIQSASSIMN